MIRLDRPPWQRADVLLAVACGGCLGTLSRYAVGQILPTAEHGFPWSTFLVNISGALLLGMLVVLLAERFPADRYARAIFGTGFLGAYTTFSTYVVQTMLLARDGYPSLATLYLLGSLVAGLLASLLGVAVGRRLGLLGFGGRT